jgi:hypothetical protein
VPAPPPAPVAQPAPPLPPVYSQLELLSQVVIGATVVASVLLLVLGGFASERPGVGAEVFIAVLGGIAVLVVSAFFWVTMLQLLTDYGRCLHDIRSKVGKRGD